MVAPTTMMDTTIETLPALRVAVIRHTGPYQEMEPAFHEALAAAGAQNLFGHGPMACATWDDPREVPAAELRSDCGLVVADDAVVQAPLQVLTYRAGRRAKAVYTGPYAGLPSAWQAFMAALMAKSTPAAPLQMSDEPCLELYLNDPSDTPQDALVTEMGIPLA